MESIKIFNEIAKIITHDFAGAEELRHSVALVPFLKYCTDRAEHFGLEDRELYLYLQLYLDVIGERRLVFDICDYAGFTHFGRGFSVRSDGHDLFVVTAEQETRLKPGDRIVQINQYPPAKFRQVSTFASDEKPLSERDCWEPYLNYAKFIVVEHDGGQTDKVVLQEFPPVPNTSKMECLQIGDGVTYLRVDDFTKTEILEDLIESNTRDLMNCKKLIVDLRGNAAGGMQETMGMIVPFIVDRKTTTSDFFQYSATHTLYSEKNCDFFMAGLKRSFVNSASSLSELAEYYHQEYGSRRGKGWMLDWDGDAVDSTQIPSFRSAQEVILLTDTGCEDEAEWFCLACKRFKGVTVLGRPSAGNIDYSNCVLVDFGYGTTFSYPISKTEDCMQGRGINQIGVPVDVYIPWTEAEIHSDVLLQAALML